ncbi:hypothetical protein [Leuconostoc lactis]|uniref:hypothetical protein n=1 Tax=Leuconostoc lactis TaxID=1246 RepID=UPI0028A1F0A8|nr:hypothetical protein [Leuconostoc lactis]
MLTKSRHAIVGMLTVIALLMLFCVLVSGHLLAANTTFNDRFTVFSLLAYLGLAMGLLGLTTLAVKLTDHYDELLKKFLWTLIILVVVGALFVQPYAPVYDNMVVSDQVYNLLRQYPSSQWAPYFSVYPNNVPISIFMFWLDFPFRHMLKTLDDAILLHAVYGQVLMLISIYQLTKLADIVFGAKARNVLLLFYVFVPTYLMQFTQIGYSDTFALPFLVAGVRYLVELFYHAQTGEKATHFAKIINRKNWQPFILAAVCLAIALFLRPNAIVALIASIVLLLVFLWCDWLLLVIFLAALTICSFTLKQAATVTQDKTHYQASNDKNLQLPIESWFLTAYYTDGRLSNETISITNKYTDYDQRQAYIREKLVGKLKQLGVIGVLTTWRDKTNVLFGIKSDFGMQYFNQFRNGQDSKLQAQYRTNYDNLTPIMIHSTMMMTLTSFLSFAWLPFYLFNKRQNESDDSSTYRQRVTIILILGIFESLSLFYILLWEVQEHYIYMMFPFLMFIGAILWSAVVNNVFNKKRRNQAFKH